MSARVLVAVLAASACGPIDVVVARLPANDTDAGTMRPTPCATNDDCAASSFCERATCGAALGECRTRPALCDGEPRASCGCNGVTYWNECLRRRAGQSVQSQGECSVPADCGGRGQRVCPDPLAVCARLSPPGSCPPPPMMGGGLPDGVCWVLPDVCPSPGVGAWQSCGPPQACEDTCRAMHSEAPHRQVASCP